MAAAGGTGLVGMGAVTRAMSAGATGGSASGFGLLEQVGRMLQPSILDGSPVDCPIDTVVVLQMENRSFDHYLGWLATDESYLEAGRSRWGSTFTVDGNQHQSFAKPDGTIVDTYRLPAQHGPNPYRGCGNHPDPGHGWDSGRAQRDHGFLAEGSQNDEYAVGYYTEADLPCYGPLARQFTTFDRYFASVMTGTYPNRYYLHSAQGDGTWNGSIPIVDGTTGLKTDTIWDKLKHAGVPCRYYGTDLPVTAFWGTKNLDVTGTIAEYLLDAATGNLPNVSFVDPGFLSGMRTDDHPHGDMRTAQAFVAAVVGTLMRGPQWHRTAVVVTYDEWGGFFDHVTPPVLPDDRGTADDWTNWGQTGFRLPVFLASPFARPGYVDHRVYDHTSILRFIEWRFLGAPAEGTGGSGWWLTQRDHHANNIGASLSPSRQTDYTLPAGAVPLVLSIPCQSQILQDVPVLQDIEDDIDPLLRQLGVDLDRTLQLEVGIGDHALAAAQEPFEALGYDTNPSMNLQELLSQG
jgi:phospholipase C